MAPQADCKCPQSSASHYMSKILMSCWHCNLHFVSVQLLVSPFHPREVYQILKRSFPFLRHPSMYKVILQPDGSTKYSAMWGQTRIYYNFPTLKKGTGPGTFVEPFPENFEVCNTSHRPSRAYLILTCANLLPGTDGGRQPC